MGYKGSKPKVSTSKFFAVGGGSKSPPGASKGGVIVDRHGNSVAFVFPKSHPFAVARARRRNLNTVVPGHTQLRDPGRETGRFEYLAWVRFLRQKNRNRLFIRKFASMACNTELGLREYDGKE